VVWGITWWYVKESPGVPVSFPYAFPRVKILLKCPDERTFLINDGKCDGFLNNAACSYDGSDCDAFNLEYPGCDVDFPDLVGNGWCSGGNYNTEACQWDGGDCLEEEE